MANVPGYTVGVAFTGGESVGVGLSIPGIYALPDELLGPLQGLNSRLDAFRDAATFFVSKSATASDSNDGTSPGEPLSSLGAAVDKANAYVTANPNALCSIHLNPGVYTESGLPYRIRRNICIKGDGILRTTTIRPRRRRREERLLQSRFRLHGLGPHLRRPPSQRLLGQAELGDQLR
jgi:hypothetical protein